MYNGNRSKNSDFGLGSAFERKSLFGAIQNMFQGVFEWRQMQLDNPPNYLIINARVVVHQDVRHTADLFRCRGACWA